MQKYLFFSPVLGWTVQILFTLKPYIIIFQHKNNSQSQYNVSTPFQRGRIMTSPARNSFSLTGLLPSKGRTGDWECTHKKGIHITDWLLIKVRSKDKKTVHFYFPNPKFQAKNCKYLIDMRKRSLQFNWRSKWDKNNEYVTESTGADQNQQASRILICKAASIAQVTRCPFCKCWELLQLYSNCAGHSPQVFQSKV